MKFKQVGGSWSWTQIEEGIINIKNCKEWSIYVVVVAGAMKTSAVKIQFSIPAAAFRKGEIKKIKHALKDGWSVGAYFDIIILLVYLSNILIFLLHYTHFLNNSVGLSSFPLLTLCSISRFCSIIDL